MEILNISKENKEVIVSLDSDELVKLCNCLYKTDDSNKNSLYHKLYGQLMMCRDLSQYGHIDDWCFEKIVEQRERAKG